MMTYLLHISDLHLVVDPQWNNMKNAILNSVSKKLINVPRGNKLLVVTGDFHNFIQNNYDQAKEFLSQLFDAMDIEPDKDVFVVPGNHDVSNTKTGNDRPFYIQAVKSKSEMLQSGIDKLLLCFDDYIEFVKTINIYPENCDKLPVSVHVRTWRNKINFLHLNTVLIADGSIKNEQMTDTVTATSDDIRRQLRYNDLPCIAIGHNSFFDLLTSQQTILSAMFFQENISAYLCGDRHIKNLDRAENRIVLSNKISSVTIPNIVSYRSSADENDTYSDFGMIWQLWDEHTNHVSLEFFKWDPKDQAELQPDGKDDYDFRKSDQVTVSTQNIDVSSSCWLSNEILIEKSQYPIKDSHVRNFLLGSHCKWNLVFSDRIVTRDIVNVLYNNAIEGGVYALVGPGGEGKSTILMQMCAKLISSGVTVFYYCGYGALKIPQNISKHDIFVLDNPPDKKEFKYFLDQIIESEQTLIIGARQNEWNLLKKSLGISDRDVIDIPIKTMTSKEAWCFADCVISNLRCFRSKKEIKEIFQHNSYGFLYAAMLMIANNKNSLEEIAHQIIENLNKKLPEAVHLLAHIVLSERYGVKFTHYQFKYICNVIKLSSKDATRALSREVSINGDKCQTRHEIISKLFFDELFSDNGLLSLDQIDSILICLLEYQIECYRNAYGPLKTAIWNSIMQLSGGISQTSLDTQKYIIDRLLDEINTQPTKYFNLLPSYLDNEETVLLFYYKCYEREYIFSDFLLPWCRLLLKNGASWTISEPYSPAWIMRNSCIKHNADSHTWRAWAQMEEEQGHVGDYESENTARWIFREACIKHNADSHTWLAWAQMEAKRGNVGDYESENTARWIFREACIKHNADSHTWRAWAQMEEEQGYVGDYESENTARWIFKEACIKHNVGSATWRAWAQMEEEQGHVGDYESENTARWIFREACVKHNADSDTWRAWAQMEEEQGHVGDYESENTARWIFREACIKHNADSHTWLAWAQMEAQRSHVGDYESENTARWIFREACVKHNADSNTWLAWAQMEEEQGHIGDYESENTARWIFREACVKHNADSNSWRAWAQMEEKQGHVGNYESENTARWIFREACIKHNADSNSWHAWAQMEAEQGHVGDYESENTARWIFREACIKHNADSNTWRAWAQMEEEQGHVGDYESENTARWIFREACVKHNADSNTWRAWAQMEEEQGRVGDYESENTARWIYSEGIKRFSNNGILYLSYACLELLHHSVQRARDILRKSIQYNDLCIGNLAILEYFCGNINSGDAYCTNQLMLRMEKEKQHSLRTLRFLYHCSALLGKEESKERYYQQLLAMPEYDSSNTSCEKFIQLCREH